jgi:hypothetical protein
MADGSLPLKSIPDLDPAASVSPSDQVWINQNGQDRRATLAQIDGASPLPPPTISTLGGIVSLAPAPQRFVNGIGTDGVPITAQPQWTDLAGTPPGGFGGTIGPPTQVVRGGVFSFVPQPHTFLIGLDTTGQFLAAQPAAADLSNGTTGSGAVALATSPQLVTPNIGDAAGRSFAATGYGVLPNATYSYAGGTPTAPTPVVAGNWVGYNAYQGWDGSAFSYIGDFACEAVGIVSPGNVGGAFVFRTRPTGAGAAIATALTLNADQSATFYGPVSAAGPITGPSLKVGPTFTPPAGANAAIYNNTAPANVYLIGDGQTANFLDTRYSSDTTPPVFSFVKYRGSYAAPAAVVSGDSAGQVNYDAWDGAAIQVVSRILGQAQTFTGANNVSGNLLFQTRPVGVGAALTTALTIDQAQIATFAQLPVWPAVNQNRFWASPVGASAAPAFRKLDVSDMPALTTANLTDIIPPTAFTPTVTFGTTVGDLAVAYTIQRGSWSANGKLTHVEVNLGFTLTYTTSAGALVVPLPGLPLALTPGLAPLGVVQVSRATGWTGSLSASVGISGGVAAVFLNQSNAASPVQSLTTTHFPTGATAYAISINVTYLAA